MFRMVSEIEVVNNNNGVVTRFRGIKPTAVKWSQSVNNFADTCSISLPKNPYLSNTVKNNTVFSATASRRETIFHEGDAVEVHLGYNYEKHRFFKGFIKQINYAQPLVLECEGYSYLLRNVSFTKSYKSATIRQVLDDLTHGTDIKLSPYIPEITLKNLTFKNMPGLNVLEWFQKECLCVVYFEEDTLFVGASRYAIPHPTHKLRVGWNTVEDKELKKDSAATNVSVNLMHKLPTGEAKRTQADKSGQGGIKEIKVRTGLPDTFLKEVRGELQKQEDYTGYKGTITAFLMPFFGKGDVCQIIDKRFPDREGKYFVESIEGSFDNRGGRQKLNLIYYGKDRK